MTIDEATISRKFGLYARVLVDVDLSSQLFDSVVVESEGFSLPISIQYELKPLFCVQCKMLGHSTQNCKKLQKDFPIKIVKKMSTKVPIVRQQPIEVLKNNVQHDKNNIETDELDQEPDAFDRESLNLIQEHDRAIDDEVVTTILQDSTHDPF